MNDETLIDPALAGPQNQQCVAPSVAQRSSAIQAGGDILKDDDLAIERAQTWTGVARFGFNAMLVSADYKNKLRLQPGKMERIIHFLTTPDAKSREKDRADAQTKHQAQQWLYQDSILYRKESRLQQPRRHVTSHEVFDILTAEHLRSGHQVCKFWKNMSVSPLLPAWSFSVTQFICTMQQFQCLRQCYCPYSSQEICRNMLILILAGQR